MTVVWKANQNSLNRTVAIRILRPEFAANPAEVQEFLTEGRTIAKLKHPGILQVYDVLQQDGTCFFVVEYVADSTLAMRLTELGKIPVKTALKIAFKTADALGYAWRTSHLIHPNIKPENIYIDFDDTVKMAFFGLSKIVSPVVKPGTEESRTIAGTPYYMSPEQAQCLPQIDCRSDMYALGTLLYHMITGHIPFGEMDPMAAAHSQVSGYLAHPRDIDPGIPQNVANLVVRLMIKDPKDRPKNWEEVGQDLQKLLAGQLVLKKPDPNMVSTVAPEAREVAAAAAAPQPGIAARVPGTPAWVQLPAWAAILFWWYLVAQFMLDYWAQ